MKKLTPKQAAWLKRGEMFVLGVVAPAVIDHIKRNGLPNTKAGWASFGTYAFGLGYGAVRLYLAQSPLSTVLDAPADPSPAPSPQGE